MKDLDAAVISEALVRHNSNGKSKVIRPNNGNHRSVIVRRSALTASLLRIAEKSGVEINCGWKLQDVNFEEQQVIFIKEEDGEKRVATYDLLVGADGVHSRTRKLLANHVNQNGGDFIVREAVDTMEYQVAVMQRPWKDLLLEEKANTSPLNQCPPASIHSWADKKTGSTAICFPIRDSNQSPIDKFLVCVIFPASELGKMKEGGFNAYTSTLSRLFVDWTPGSRLDLARILAEEDNVPSTGGVCVWSQALSHPESGVVLIGDAGHGMWPSLGQGGNCALESVSGKLDNKYVDTYW